MTSNIPTDKAPCYCKYWYVALSYNKTQLYILQSLDVCTILVVNEVFINELMVVFL